ncbi:MFS transporter [Yinghuangia seranimata]|uniref:MFS transporter n=1 Tax=Yinghuangia seranimata TaxID=408067 RepID=UPI00248AAF7D|nr:MFS transporter [Yinghuangia seranimata]MDI2130953.1 MFS transporter [Yinghuangia seranimata]
MPSSEPAQGRGAPKAASEAETASPATPVRHAHGSSGYRRVNLALFLAGCATFAMLYTTQTLLPQLSDRFGLTPAQASVSVSVTTGALALAVIPVSMLSERWGRVRVMTVSVFAAALLGVLAAFAPDFGTLVALRTLQGVALAGLPATAMAYLAEEIEAPALPAAMGLYVAGNSIGGMGGRLVTGFAADLGGWRVALFAVGLLALSAAVAFRVLVPRSRNFRPGGLSSRAMTATLRGHLADPTLRRLYLLGMLFMAAFGTVYNYLGYRLLAPPFGLPEAVVGAIFVIYLAGTFSSAAAGRLVGRFGHRTTLWAAVAVTAAGALLTLPDHLVPVVLGLVVLTAGFFAGHATASSAVGLRAKSGRAQASALYIAAYYLGSSLGGPVGGVAFHRVGWAGAVLFVLAVCAAAAVAATAIRSTGSPRATSRRASWRPARSPSSRPV